MTRDLTLSIDVGTGSVRAALVDGNGAILHIAAREHDQIVPQFGWAEQRPLDWWAGVAARDPRRARARSKTRASGSRRSAPAGRCTERCSSTRQWRPTRETAPLWNDKRTAAIGRRFRTRAWPLGLSFRKRQSADSGLARLQADVAARQRPAAYAAARTVLMPKDFINLRLTGEIAMDSGDASCSFLMNPRSPPHGQTR